MKILHVLNELRPSGAETMLRLAAPTWARLGYECDILATGQRVGSYVEALADVGYKVQHLPLRKNPAYLRSLYRLVRDQGYTIVHQHAEAMRFWSCVFALAAGARVVTTVHSNFQFGGLLRLRRALQRKTLQRLGVTFVAIAPGVLANEYSRFGVRSRLIWNWFDTDRFRTVEAGRRESARSSFGYDSDDKVIVTLGNCSAVKNHDSVLHALQQLPDVKYLHVGEEEAAQRERSLAVDLGVADRVQFAGWMGDPSSALAAADIYVMPSIYEGLGIAALEAIGSGVPCLLARSPGLIDLETLSLDLTYAEPEPSDMADKLTSMLGSLDQLRQSAGTNSAKIAERLRPEAGATAYANIYVELACSR